MRGAGPGRILLLSLIASALIPWTRAQAQEGPTLTLDEALGRASEHNPSYRQAINDLRLNEIEKKQAWAAYLPSLRYSVSTNLGLNRRLVAEDDFGNPIENPSTSWSTSTSTSSSISSSLVIWDWGARSRERATTNARARVREATLTSRLRTLRADVVRAYRSAQNQQALLAVEEELLASRQLDLETTQRMFELAGASRVDVLTAELAVRQQEGRIEDARGALQQALLRLRTIMGDESLEGFTVASDMPEPFDPSSLVPQRLADRAYASNPTLIVGEANLAVSEAQVESARRSNWPGIELSFSGSQGTRGSGWSGFGDPFSDDSRSAGGGFGISIPLFDRFQHKATVVQAEVALANQEETVRNTRLQVEESVESRLIALQTAYQSYEIAVQSGEIAEERLILGREQFRLGSRTFTELQQDIDAAASAQRTVINQLFALERALADLEEMVGEELR